MRVRAIHCSNILSFKRAEDFSKDKTTIRLLATNKPQGAMHLLIGPNGSGKTNFMTILKTVLTKYIMPACEYFPQYRNDLEKRKQTLLLHKPTWNLSSHRAYQDKPQQIELELELTDRDLQHIQTLRDHKEELATAISTYSNISDIDPKRRSKPGQTRPQRYVTITISAE